MKKQNNVAEQIRVHCKCKLSLEKTIKGEYAANFNVEIYKSSFPSH